MNFLKDFITFLFGLKKEENYEWKQYKVTVKCSRPKMKLHLNRSWYGNRCTVGELSIDGKYECLILEDEDRLSKGMIKKYGETAIPRGEYEIRITYSKRFKRQLPILISVPGFLGIRIHTGNTARDTEGCLLPGEKRVENTVRSSRRAFNKLFKRLQAAKKDSKKITIRID